MTENCCCMQGRLFQLWQCVRDQTEQIEKIPPPPPPTHFIFIFVFFIFYFIPDQFNWCIAAAVNIAIVVSVIVDVVLYPAVVLHRAPVPAFG